MPHLVAMRSSSSSLRLLLRRPPLGLDAAAAAAEGRDLRERIGLMNILDILTDSTEHTTFSDPTLCMNRVDGWMSMSLYFSDCSVTTDIESSTTATDSGGWTKTELPLFSF